MNAASTSTLWRPSVFKVVTCFLAAVAFLAFSAPLWMGENSWLTLYPYGPDTPSILTSQIFASPGDHWLGTDRVGRDVFALILFGIRNSFLFSLAVVSTCAVIGTLLGGLMGMAGGRIDMLLSRFLEIVANFPVFFLQLTLLAFFDRGYGILFFVMIFSGWIPYTRLTRAEFLKIRKQDYIAAAQVLGASKLRIFFRHLLPNGWAPSLIYIPFDFSSTIVSLGALSFLGFGEPINVPSLGELMNQARENFQSAWWIAFFPSITLFLMTLALILFGTSLRDRLDPKAASLATATSLNSDNVVSPDK